MSGKREKEIELKQKIELRLEKAPGILRIYNNHLIDSGKSYDTVYRYINYILQFIKYTFGDNWSEKFYREVKPIHIIEYIASMKTNSTNSISDSITGVHWSALNSFFGFLVGSYIESNPVSETQRPKNNDKPQLTYLTNEEIAGLLENVKNTAQTRFVNRDLCILKLGFSTGLSVGTIVQLDIEDINFEKNQIRIAKKKHDDQYVIFGKNLKSQLLSWLADRTTYFGNSTSSALFVSQYGTRISDDSIGRLLKKYAKGITDKPIHPHVMRNSCATNLYKKTGDIYLCSKQLNHASVYSTIHYIKDFRDQKSVATDVLDAMIDTNQHSNVLSDEHNNKSCALNAEIPIEELELSVRAYNYLKRAELNTLSEIINCMETDFSSFLYQMHSSRAVVNNLLLAIKGLGLSTDRYEKLLCSSDDVAKRERRESGQKTLVAKQTNVPSIGVLIIYLTKVPRYKNIITDEYETIPHKDIVLIDKYFSWGKARYEAKYEGGKYGCDTLEEWCGISESQLPHKYIVNYYRDFFTEKNSYSEMLGMHQCYTIFEHITRIAKANQIFAWFIKNVMSDTMDREYHEVSREQIKNLLNVCKQVVGENSVNVELAKELLPLMDKHGYFFGTDSYNEIYAAQVTTMIDVLEEVLKTTDFERETVYFNAVW